MLIRLALEGCGQVINQAELEEELALIECMYLGDGWYMDGKTTQRDYYISFAFHYYSLIYVKFMRERDLFVRNVLQNEPLCSRRTICTILMRRAKRYLTDVVKRIDLLKEHFRSFDICRSRGFTLGTNKTLLAKHLLLDATGYFHL